MRVFRSLAATFLLGFVSLTWPGEASPRSADRVEGISQRGVGARTRQQVDRTLASADSPRIDDLLLDLRVRRDDLGEVLDADTLDGLAREVIHARNASIVEALPVSPLRRAFIGELADGATFSDWRHGIPASVSLAQAILESGWGRSAPAFNYFGIKGVGPAGSTPAFVVEWSGGRRHLRKSALRAYHSPDEALSDHARTLLTLRVYARARAAAHDSDAFARALVGVYATDPGYARKLAVMMDDFGLRAFDVLRPAAEAPTAI